MVATFKVFLDLRRQKKDKTYPLKLRINLNNRLKEVPLNIYLPASYWDQERQRIKRSHPNAQQISLRINQTISSYQEKLISLQNQNRYFSLEDIVAANNKSNRLSVKDFAAMEIRKLNKAGKNGNALSYQCAINKLDKFIQGREIRFEEIDYRFLYKFTTYMLETGMTVNGIAVYMREIRALFNKAIKSDLVDPKYYPFNKYKIETQKTVNRLLSVSQMRDIVALPLKPETALWHCRNYFLISFCLIGISFVDLINLTSDNIAADRIIYRRRKTKKIYSIKIQPQLVQLLNYYTPSCINHSPLYSATTKHIFRRSAKEKIKGAGNPEKCQ